MGEISFNVPYRDIRNQLAEISEDYVKHIWEKRRTACILSAGELLEDNGYLPSGTTYEAWGDQLWFSVEKNGAELAHYFHEGIQYGPNFYIKKLDAWRSPKGKPKHPVHEIYTQGQYTPAGVAHWTDALSNELYPELCEEIGEILRR